MACVGPIMTRQCRGAGAVHPINGKLRDELLNETLFRSLPHARAVLDAWRRDYNTERPHSRLGWLTPIAYAACLQAPSSHRDRPLLLSGGSAAGPVASSVGKGFIDPRTPAATG